MRRITLAVVVAGALLGGVSPAGAVPLACGTTITANTTLTSDLSCAGDGITIGAPGVVLDLGGHTITGGGAGFTDEGVGVRARSANARVKNGRVSNFRYGIYLGPGANGSVIEGLSLIGDGDGIHVQSSSNRIRGNFASRNTNVAVALVGDFNVLEGNALLDNIAGVVIGRPGNQVIGNDISGDAGGDRGVLSFNGGRVVGNRVSLFGGAPGIDLLDGGEVIGNQAFANLDGIRVRGAAVVSGNVVFGNIDDGIDFAAGSAFIRGNTATQNGDLGINAAGAFDGGGNRAFANANPLQCVGVVCS